MPVRRQLSPLTWLLYAFATLQFIRYYVVSTRFYLSMPRYMSGHERLPFQERVLPIALMWPINHFAPLMNALAAHQGASTPGLFAFYLVSLLGFSLAGVFCVKLYRAVTTTGTLQVLVYPIFLVIALWTYVIHLDADFSYPYDMLSLAFFTAGLYFIYTRQFAALAATMLLGTVNRETTLFLIPIFMIDAASEPLINPNAPLRQRFNLRRIPWARVAILLGIWLALKLTLTHIFANNDPSENYVRIRENLGRLRPRLLPAMLNICGYLLPVVVILRRRLRPIRFSNYLYVLPLWIAIMFYTGVILETRIYGELCSFTAIAVVLLLEQHMLQQRAIPPIRQHLRENPLSRSHAMEADEVAAAS